ncbi:TauD/TfdA dioxygenase family protein [Mycobacterium sp. C31M]
MSSTITTEVGYDTISVQPMPGGVGAQIVGLDLRDELSDAVINDIRVALANHCVVSLGVQDIKPSQYEAFAKRFGKVYIPSLTGCVMAPGTEGLAVLDAEGVGVTARKAGGDWHVDELWTATPNELATIRSAELPPRGAGTAFSSMYKAYDALTQPMKDLIDPLQAEYSASISVKNYTLMAQKTDEPERRERYEAAARNAAALPPVVHDLVKVHPITGRKYLCYTHHVFERVVGLSQPESQMLSEFLYAHIASLDFIYTHHWTLGEVAMWDERLCQHAGVLHQGVPGEPPRVMWRVYIQENPYTPASN